MTVTLDGEDQKIKAVLEKHSTADLIAFREKLQKINTPRSLAIRFHILIVLFGRAGYDEEDCL